MLKSSIILASVILVLAVLWLQPWRTRRYDDTPAGQEARRIDEHVDQALDWRPPDKIEMKIFLAQRLMEGVEWEMLLDGLSHKQMTTLGNTIYAAGATEVAFINISRGIGIGDVPEGLIVILPDDPATRAAIFTAAAPLYKALSQKAPGDVRQKYLYVGFGRWSPDEKTPSFMPN